ncbi:hypothetical protein DV737_g1164, partial [Chaetothyriales sp. CBS 132003]
MSSKSTKATLANKASSNISPWLKVAVVQTVPDMQHLVDSLGDYLSTNPVSLYLNFEGIKLGGPHIHIGKMVLFIPSRSTVYVIDLPELGPSAFSISRADDEKQTLKSILESDRVPKAIFDVRNTFTALSRLHNIALQNIHDVQLMELATRNADTSKRYLAGWDKCIAEDGSINPAVDLRGQPPLPLVFDPRILQLPVLWAKYHAKLTSTGMAFWVYMVRKATKDRVTKPKRLPSYTENSTSNDTLGPWAAYTIEDETDKWNDRCLEDALCGEHSVDYTLFRAL